MATVKIICVMLLSMFILLSISNSVEGAYRKPPFNGSIFGKRAGGSGKNSFNLNIVSGTRVTLKLHSRF